MSNGTTTQDLERPEILEEITDGNRHQWGVHRAAGEGCHPLPDALPALGVQADE